MPNSKTFIFFLVTVYCWHCYTAPTQNIFYNALFYKSLKVLKISCDDSEDKGLLFLLSCKF